MRGTQEERIKFDKLREAQQRDLEQNWPGANQPNHFLHSGAKYMGHLDLLAFLCDFDSILAYNFIFL